MKKFYNKIYIRQFDLVMSKYYSKKYPKDLFLRSVDTLLKLDVSNKGAYYKVRFHTKILRKELGRNYQTILKYLIEANVVESDNSYVVNQKSKYYQLTPLFSKLKVFSPELEFITHTYVDVWVTKRYKKRGQKIWDRNPRFRSHFYNLLYGTLDLKQAIKISKELLLNGTINAEGYDYYIKTIDMYVNGNWWFSNSKNTGRDYYSWTSLPKHLEQAYYVDGEPLTSLDQSSTFPYFIAEELKSLYPDNNDVNNFYEDVIKYKDNEHPGINEIIKEKMKITENTGIYTKNFKEYDIEDTIKKEVITYINKSNRGYSPLSNTIETYYPDFAEKLKDYKRNHHIANELTKKESKVFLTVSERLSKEGIYNLPKHDAIFVKPSDKILLEKYLNEEFTKQGYKNYKLK